MSEFRETDCDTDHYLVGAKVRQRLYVSKRAVREFDMEKINFQEAN